ncbi:drug/metabolite transporter (DMT)-like permease [Planomicrobium stackebrandtii]|uniref:Drug/metabolite transporter (DMT)-like permease n=1 Tax=Planomicrobium stackebrandtii TaxID=253160 RepID=A0ABU0GS80_9BACL|nr:EamA family transporter [Planomicrobium stackebrandtii]MDQ0428221.1 drug/metabolite transporter (DMT)-like permease [Planomicrobium stackebrandtii]
MQRLKGVSMILIGAMLWGATGPLMEWTMEIYGISVPFLLTIRLIVAGLLLLLFLKLKGVRVTAIFRNKTWIRPLLIFSILGMLGVQYSFVAAIEASNAVVATLMQFLAPVYIILFVSITHKKIPPSYQIIGMAGTLGGMFLLLTNGRPDQLIISGQAFFWGILVGLAFTFYTLYPARLMQEWGVLLVVGWSMLFGGIFLGLVNPIFLSDEWPILTELPVIGAILAIIVIGTAAFVLFLSSMRYITAVETSILSSLEPLTAMVISMFWFGQVLSPVQLFGALAMLIFVTWLSLAGNPKKNKLEAE